MTKKTTVNSFIKERFGNSSQWYLEKQCAVSNTKRTAFVSRRGSFSTACLLLLSYNPFTLASFAAISAAISSAILRRF